MLTGTRLKYKGITQVNTYILPTVIILLAFSLPAKATGHFWNGMKNGKGNNGASQGKGNGYGHCYSKGNGHSNGKGNGHHKYDRDCAPDDEPGNGKNKLFSAQVKVEGYQPHDINTGDDIFVRYGDTNYGASENVNWSEHDTDSNSKRYRATFAWSLTRTDNLVTFGFGEQSLTYVTDDGKWEGVGLLFNTPGNNEWLYDYAWLNLTVDEWNEDPLDEAFSYTSSLGDADYFELFDADEYVVESISGSMTFDWDMNYWSNFFYDNPSDDFSVWVSGVDYDEKDFKIEQASVTSPPGDGNTEQVPTPLTGILTFLMSGALLVSIGRRGRSQA